LLRDIPSHRVPPACYRAGNSGRHFSDGTAFLFRSAVPKRCLSPEHPHTLTLLPLHLLRFYQSHTIRPLLKVSHRDLSHWLARVTWDSKSRQSATTRAGTVYSYKDGEIRKRQPSLRAIERLVEWVPEFSHDSSHPDFRGVIITALTA